MSKAVLLIDWMSQPSRAVAWFCTANKIPHEIKEVRLARGDAKSLEFRAISPLGKVPALKGADGSCQYESHSIIRYLAHTYRNLVPESMFPSEASNFEARLAMERYLDFHHLGVRGPCIGVFRSAYLTPLFTGQPAIEPVVEQSVKDLHFAMQQLNSSPWFTTRPFILGDSASAADMLCYSELIQLRMLGIDFASNQRYPEIAAWFRRMDTQPGRAESHAAFDVVAPKTASRFKESAIASKL